jgi:hypothetical protein
VDIYALGEPWLGSQEATQLRFQCAGERFRECGEENSGLGLGASKVCGTVQGDNGFPCACGACDAGGAVVVALDPFALAGVEEDGPFFPRVVEGLLEFVGILNDAEAAFGIGMLEGACFLGCFGDCRLAAGGEFEQRLGGFCGEPLGECQ